jgi:hypothetical protein
VLALGFQCRWAVEVHDLAVDPCADETLRTQFVEQLQMLAFARRHDRREQHQCGPVGQCEQLVDHLAHRLRGQVDTVVRAARDAGACVQQAQIVVDLGYGTDRGAWVVRSRFLLDRDRRGQALDVVEVGLFHHRQELARVGRQRFDVAALALGINRIERERGFA